MFVLFFLASVCVLHLSDNPSTLLQAITVLGLQQVLKFVETKTNEMSSRKRMCVIIFSLWVDIYKFNFLSTHSHFKEYFPIFFDSPNTSTCGYHEWMTP